MSGFFFRKCEFCSFLCIFIFACREILAILHEFIYVVAKIFIYVISEEGRNNCKITEAAMNQLMQFYCHNITVSSLPEPFLIFNNLLKVYICTCISLACKVFKIYCISCNMCPSTYLISKLLGVALIRE